MQPSTSVGPPVSSSSWSPPLPAAAAAIVVPAGHSALFAAPLPLPAAPAPAVLVELLLVELPVVELLLVLEELLLVVLPALIEATATPTPRTPFIPAAAWPATAQRNSYLPFLPS